MIVSWRSFAVLAKTGALISIRLIGKALRKFGWGFYEVGFSIERWAMRRLTAKGGQD